MYQSYLLQAILSFVVELLAGNVLLDLVVDIPTDVSEDIPAFNESAVAGSIGDGEGREIGTFSGRKT